MSHAKSRHHLTSLVVLVGLVLGTSLLVPMGAADASTLATAVKKKVDPCVKAKGPKLFPTQITTDVRLALPQADELVRYSNDKKKWFGKAHLQVRKKVKKKWRWVTMPKVVVKKTWQKDSIRVDYTLPKLSGSVVKATKQFRICISPTKKNPYGPRVSFISKVTYLNVDHLSGLAKRAYSFSAPYCSRVVPLAVIEPGSSPFDGSYTAGQGAYELVQNALENRGDPYLKTVALHECAHYVQFATYGYVAKDYDRLLADAAKAFGGDESVEPIERMADCMMKSVYPAGEIVYGDPTCTATELSYAKKVMTSRTRMF